MYNDQDGTKLHRSRHLTSAPNHEHRSGEVPRPSSRLWARPVSRTAMLASVLGLAFLGAACGGQSSPGVAASGSGAGSHRSSSTNSSEAMARAVAYARCMRGHHISDFPDPIPSPGGGVAFQINAGPGSDLNNSDPRFKAADRSCHSLLPDEGQSSPPPAQKIAAEVKWALCIRSHGLPSFPDPDARGAFDSSRFNDSSPAFQTASKACEALEPAGPISAVPGHGSGP